MIKGVNNRPKQKIVCVPLMAKNLEGRKVDPIFLIFFFKIDMTDFDKFSTLVFYNIILLKLMDWSLKTHKVIILKIVSTLLGIKMCKNYEIFDVTKQLCFLGRSRRANKQFFVCFGITLITITFSRENQLFKG